MQLPGVDERDFIEACLLSSISDETPEGKSIIELGRETGRRMRDLNTTGARMIKFTAETKCSGVDLQMVLRYVKVLSMLSVRLQRVPETVSRKRWKM